MSGPGIVYFVILDERAGDSGGPIPSGSRLEIGFLAGLANQFLTPGVGKVWSEAAAVASGRQRCDRTGRVRSMDSSRFRIPKLLRQVTLWIHPEGRVVGSLFVSPSGAGRGDTGDPLEALNEQVPFVVLQRESPAELRFYNKNSIVSVEYQEETAHEANDVRPIDCTLFMMDGSRVDGTVRRVLPPTRSRLYDYLNLAERFAKLDLEAGRMLVVNKAYIVYAREVSAATEAGQGWPPAERSEGEEGA
jgi:hypothetical protein